MSIRDEVRVWRLNRQAFRVDALERLVIDLRKELDMLRTEPRKLEQITVRIEPDYERGQIDALNDFKEGND